MTRRQLRKWRELRGWTQTEAAKHAGVTLRHWQRWESGETPIEHRICNFVALRDMLDKVSP